MSLAGSWSAEYRREDRLLPVCQEIEQDLRLRLPAEEARDAFWRLVDSFRKTLMQGDCHYRRNPALFGERATITMIDYAPDMTFGTIGGGACLAQF